MADLDDDTRLLELIATWRQQALMNGVIADEAYKVEGDISKGSRFDGRANVYRICAEELTVLIRSLRERQAEASTPQDCTCGHPFRHHHPNTDEAGTSCWVQFCACDAFVLQPAALPSSEGTPQEANRYFVHRDGFKDDTRYLRVNAAGEVWIHLYDGSSQRYWSQTLSDCTEKVERGVWRELTEPAASTGQAEANQQNNQHQENQHGKEAESGDAVESAQGASVERTGAHAGGMDRQGLDGVRDSRPAERRLQHRGQPDADALTATLGQAEAADLQADLDAWAIFSRKPRQAEAFRLQHLAHCYQGEHADACKYGDDDCPARPAQFGQAEATPPADLRWLIASCEQTARDGIMPSRAWFTETADTLRTVLAALSGASEANKERQDAG